MNQPNHPQTADIGDYMKVFACTAVILQSVLAFVLKTQPNFANQNIIGFLYNLVKFTAPAFIFGILYTTTRQAYKNLPNNFLSYLKKQFSALFVPTIIWTLIYLLVSPQLQQHRHFDSFSSFIWQFINGNAAPHLWYNTMMLQFILIMPLFWLLANFTRMHPLRSLIILIITSIFYIGWLLFYNRHFQSGNWYLLDRIFISFIIYAILGVLAWTNRKVFEIVVKRSLLILIGIFLIALIWTNYELFSFGYPIKLTNAPYYKLSMTVYALTVIGLIAVFAIHQINHQKKALPIFHFLATYAYRAYLSNVFWLQLLWIAGEQTISKSNPLLAIISCYLLTWVLSFTSAYYLNVGWNSVKGLVFKTFKSQIN